eukprot:5234688-Prymnesium_polylepis.1
MPPALRPPLAGAPKSSTPSKILPTVQALSELQLTPATQHISKAAHRQLCAVAVRWRELQWGVNPVAATYQNDTGDADKSHASGEGSVSDAADAIIRCLPWAQCLSMARCLPPQVDAAGAKLQRVKMHVPTRAEGPQFRCMAYYMYVDVVRGRGDQGSRLMHWGCVVVIVMSRVIVS